jgi:hypothetical protein
MPVETGSGLRAPGDGRRPVDSAAPTRRLPRRRLAALVGVAAVLVAAVVAIVLLAGGGDDDNDSEARRAPAVAATAAELAELPDEVGHPVFWAGPRAGTTYELTRTASGRVYLRYLPAGVPVGTDQADHLTIGSYPQRDALATLAETARAQGVATVPLRDGGRAFQDERRPTSAYAAFPGADVQVEVFDATPGRALRVIASGELARLGVTTRADDGTVAPRIVTEAGLRAFAASHDGSVWWAGPRADARYELTSTADGRVYVRYLTAGVAAGSNDPAFLTVGTYPQADALATLEQTARRRGDGTFPVAGGGVGTVVDGSPDSVYVAFPGADAQIELFDPDGDARSLAVGGELTEIR